MDTLITKFVNHTNNSGSWDNQATIPNWTEATIITAIGDGSRLSAPTDPLISAPWLYQQYKMLNLLRWVKVQGQWDRERQLHFNDNADWNTAWK